jgi:hypothetical protein
VHIYDLCLAWNWEYDADFVRLLDTACTTRGLSLLNVSAQNLGEVLTHLAGREVGFRVLFDRASEAVPVYLPLVEFARSSGTRRINPRELADRAYDKAGMHHAFVDDGIPTPPTAILPAFNLQPELPSIKLEHLGKQFTVKPALGGGGEGVIMKISTLEQVQSARTQFPEQQYLLQAHVEPTFLDGLPAWFRVIYCLGEIYISFWDTTTHIYTRVTPEQETRLGLGSLREVTKRIARLCCLELFSSEIALTDDCQLQVVDYVNDPIDLRLQSRAIDGAPDEIVVDIAARIAASACL